jgi:hypothetical protein
MAGGSFSGLPGSLFSWHPPGAGSALNLCHVDYGGHRTILARLAPKLHNGFSVSSDERSILSSRVETVATTIGGQPQ